MATGTPPILGTVYGEIAFFHFLWTSLGKNYTLNFVDATLKCENRRTSENALLDSFFLYSATAISVVTPPRILLCCYQVCLAGLFKSESRRMQKKREEKGQRRSNFSQVTQKPTSSVCFSPLLPQCRPKCRIARPTSVWALGILGLNGARRTLPLQIINLSLLLHPSRLKNGGLDMNIV